MGMCMYHVYCIIHSVSQGLMSLNPQYEAMDYQPLPEIFLFVFRLILKQWSSPQKCQNNHQ